VTTILHVEDDIALAETVRDAFEAFGFRGKYVLAQSVAEARRILDDTSSPLPDLVICDMHLPDGTGLDVVRNIRANPALAHLPIVILSGDVEGDHVSHAYVLGANAYIGKASRGRTPLDVMRTLYAHWFKDARLPGPPGTTRTHRYVARTVNIRTRKAAMCMRIGERLGAADGAFWMDLALREGNLANLIAFLVGQLGERELPAALLDEAEAAQRDELRQLDALEQMRVRTHDDAQQFLRKLVANFQADIIARVIAQLFPVVPVAMTALRAIAAGTLDDIAAWVDAHGTDAQLRAEARALHADAARLRG
jgi:CheY-like chemotaxis protein